MFFAIVVFVIAFAAIVSEKVDRMIAAILGATVLIMFRSIPYEEAVARIDFNVIFLLVGMMMVVYILAETGLFEWVAVVIAQKARGDGRIILAGLLVATAVLSALLDNVTTVVLMTPVTILITQILGLPTVPFLLLEALFSNIGGTATLIGDPPNILIGSQSHLTFNQFALHLGPVVLITMALTIPCAALLLGTSLSVPPEVRERILKATPNRAITDPFRLRRGLIVFLVLIGGFSLSHAVGIEPGLLALAGAAIMVVVCRSDLHRTMQAVEWNTIFFLIGLFMLVGGLEYHGLFHELGAAMFSLTKGQFFLTVMAILWVSAILSAVMGNIPVVIAMIPLVKSIEPVFADQLGVDGDLALTQVIVTEPLFWALALGTCFGGNGTLYGAAANVVVAQIATRNHFRITYTDFLRYGAPMTLASLVVASMYIWVRYFLLAPI